MVFKQIAGLIARRIVFNKKPGDRVATGERVGLIKFGSRVDVLFGPEWEIVVRPGMRVAAGSSVIARRRDGGAGAWGLETGWSTRARRTAGPRRAAYALPTLFTAGNIFLGYLSILRPSTAPCWPPPAPPARPSISPSPPKPLAPPCSSMAWTAASRA